MLLFCFFVCYCFFFSFFFLQRPTEAMSAAGTPVSMTGVSGSTSRPFANADVGDGVSEVRRRGGAGRGGVG